MTAPAKPWEGVGPNLRFSSGDPGVLQSSCPAGNISSYTPPVLVRRPAPMRTAIAGRVAPPIPARSNNMGGLTGIYPQGYGTPTSFGASYGMGGYGSSYGGYGAGGYGASALGGYGASALGGYGAYGGGAYGRSTYGSQGYGTGGYGMNGLPHQQGINSFESRFIQMAEANSRPAFESIESLVQAFGSVSFMMESTFHAMYSSFRAVLGVAENFGRLRSLFGQVFQTFAVLRLFQWIYRKLLYYLGIRSDNPGREAVWRQATGQLDPKTRRTFWPVAMFLSLVCGGPFLVWRLLRSINVVPPISDSATAGARTWINGSEGPVVTLAVAVALYDFTAVRANELTMKRGQHVFVAPSHLQIPNSDWLLVTQNWKESGLVPANYLQIVEHRDVQRAKSKPANVAVKPTVIPVRAELSSEIKEQKDPLSSYPVQGISPFHDTRFEQHLPIIPAGQQQANAQTNKSAAPRVLSQQEEVTRTMDSSQLQPMPQPVQATAIPDHLDQSRPTNTNDKLENSS